MLQAIREKAQGWIAWVIVVLIGLTFILFWGGGSFFSSSEDTSKTVASVNGEKITQQDLNSQYDKVIQQQDRSLAQLDPTLVKKELLSNLIREKVLIQTASEMGFTVNPQRVDLFITHSPIFLQNGQFSQEAYRRFLYNMNISDKDFRDMLASQLLQQQLYAGLVNTSFVVAPDVENFLKFYTQKRSFKYTTIQRAPLADKVQLSESEVKEYYDKNESQFYSPDKVAIDYIRLTADDVKQKIKTTPEQLRAFYDENVYLFNDPERRLIAHILVQLPQNADEATVAKAQETVDEIKAKLKKGETFEALAKTYSDDTQTKDEGGKLDWIVKGEMGLPALEKATFNLSKGQVSDPVRTEYGIHFIKLLDLEAEKRYSFEEVKDKVAKTVKERQAEDELIGLADKMANLAYDKPDSLDPIVDQLELKIQSTGLFDKNKGPEDKTLNHQSVIDAAFSDYVKLDGNNSDLLNINDKEYIVLRVKESVPSKLKPFEEVKQDIKIMLTFEQSNQMAREQAKSIQAFVKAADESGLKNTNWQEKTAVSRNDTDLDHFLLNRAFELPRSATDEPIVDVVQLENNDFAVLWLTDIIEGTDEELKDFDKTQIQDHLKRQMGELEFLLFTKDRFEHAAIKNTLEAESAS